MCALLSKRLQSNVDKCSDVSHTVVQKANKPMPGGFIYSKYIARGWSRRPWFPIQGQGEATGWIAGLIESSCSGLLPPGCGLNA